MICECILVGIKKKVKDQTNVKDQHKKRKDRTTNKLEGSWGGSRRDYCPGVCHLMLVLAGSTTLREARWVTQAEPGSTGESELKPLKCCGSSMAFWGRRPTGCGASDRVSGVATWGCM